jgi:probable HAF family extracellular repeat protein
MIDLGTLGRGNGGYAASVNNDGAVVGYTTTTGNEIVHAFVWSLDGGMLDLGASDLESYASGISHEGLVVGNNFTADGQGLQGFAWTSDGGMVGLDWLGRQYSQVYGVSKNGIIFGFSYNADGSGHATVWRATDIEP